MKNYQLRRIRECNHDVLVEKLLWRKRHVEDMGKVVSHCLGYSMDKLEKVRILIKNPVCSEIYNSLKKFRTSVLQVCPVE